ncbi:hypothetical protein [Gottfriedia luciferensis]|uniref:hypothetical protein n=1 Tax=Gottfriedia luciferensis TaxID=178774 RepID=UPI000B44095D|nr:hypothetical protein [Gottfriedia luciferensis]
MIWIAGGAICLIGLVAVFNVLAFGKSPTHEKLSDKQLQESESVKHDTFPSNGGKNTDNRASG